MLNLVWDEGFKKSYRKRIRENVLLKNKFWKTIKIFSENPHHRQLRTHKLSGELEGLWAFSVAYDCRVVFQFINDKEVLLIDIGSHEEVY